MTTRITTTMNDALLKIAAWLSPGFPVGSFAYAHGLETVIAEGTVSDAATMLGWLADILRFGSGRTDAILLIHAHRAASAGDAAAWAAVADLAAALAPSQERLRETTEQGTAFATTIGAGWGGGDTPAPYPVAVGRAAAEAGAEAETAAAFYLHAFAANLTSAAIRLMPMGQVAGQRILAALHPLIHDIAAEAATASLDEIGGSALAADIASMRHETQATRLFRT